MAGAETSWQGIGRPQCGQHKLLSFARIIAVQLLLLLLSGFFCPACLCGAHGLWPDSAIAMESRLPSLRSGSSWLSLFLRTGTTSFPPSCSHCSRQVTLFDISFCWAVGRYYGLLRCSLVAATSKSVGRRERTILQQALCPAMWWKDPPCHLASMKRWSAFRLAQRCWLPPASYVCHVGHWSGEDLWHRAGCKRLPQGSIKQKQRARAEASFCFSIQQSNWTVYEQNLISRMAVIGCWSSQKEWKKRTEEAKKRY